MAIRPVRVLVADGLASASIRSASPLLIRGTLNSGAKAALAGNADALAQLIADRDRRLVEPLIGLLGDSSREVRENAARVLEALEEPLGRLFCDALGVGGQAIHVMVQTGDKRAVAPLIRTLLNPEAPMRRNAAIASSSRPSSRRTQPRCAFQSGLSG